VLVTTKCWPCKSNPVRLGSYVSRASARREIAGFRPGSWPQGQYRQTSSTGARGGCAPSLCSAHRSVHRVPMRGDLLQGAGRGPSGRLQTLNDRLDVSHALLDGVGPFPRLFSSWARTSFSLLSAAMTGSPILSRLAVSEVFEPRGRRASVIRCVVPSGSESSPARRARHDVCSVVGRLGQKHRH
jgi:hypothetical protein